MAVRIGQARVTERFAMMRGVVVVTKMRACEGMRGAKYWH
jgi:hypothetical protein